MVSDYNVSGLIGHRELVIYPIDPNGETLVLTVYSASHNTCGASPYALRTSKNMKKGKRKEKTSLHPLFFQLLHVV